jgi:hypothetical protein
MVSKLPGLLMTLTEAGSWFQTSGDELLDGLQRRYLPVDHERRDPVPFQILGGSPSHAVTENGVTVLECRYDAGVAVRLVVMPMFAITLAFGVGGECVGAHRAITNFVAVDIEDDEALGSAKMV